MTIYYAPAAQGVDALILVMKYQSGWNQRLYGKLSKVYHLFIIYADEEYRQSGSVGVSYRIDNAADEIKKVNLRLEAVIFDLEFYPEINFIPVLIGTRKKYKTGMFSFDEPYLFNTNVVYASCCDFVLTTCPLAVYKYQEADVQVEFFFMESQDDYSSRDVEPAYDLVFFGQSIIGTRRLLIDEAKRAGLSVLTSAEIGTGNNRPNLSDFMAKGKLVLNPMRSTSFPVIGHPSWDHIETPVRWYRQHKTRVYEAAWSGRYSITEYSPATRLLFSSEELFMFGTPAEMVAKVRDILADGDTWKALGVSLRAVCIERYGDVPMLKRLQRFLGGVVQKADSDRNQPVFSAYGFADRQIALLRRYAHFSNPQMVEREVEIFRRIAT